MGWVAVGMGSGPVSVRLQEGRLDLELGDTGALGLRVGPGSLGPVTAHNNCRWTSALVPPALRSTMWPTSIILSPSACRNARSRLPTVRTGRLCTCGVTVVSANFNPLVSALFADARFSWAFSLLLRPKARASPNRVSTGVPHAPVRRQRPLAGTSGPQPDPGPDGPS